MAARYPGVECFWAETTDVAQHELRVVEGDSGDCPTSPWGNHHARKVLPGKKPLVKTDGGFKGDFKKPDRGWPAKCQWCDRRFTKAAKRYTDVERLYAVEGRGMIPLCGPNGEGGLGPPGMLFHSDWHPFGEWTDRYGDGINLYAVCPNGSVWNVDGPAYGEGKVTTEQAWTRTGDPRDPKTLNVTPSIVAGDYHGHLTDGRFTDDLGA